MTKPLILSIGTKVEWLNQGHTQTALILDAYLDDDDIISYHIGGGYWLQHEELTYIHEPTLETLREARKQNCLYHSCDEYDIA